jgi:hypothetical protein
MAKYVISGLVLILDSGHDGFWFMGGNLALARTYSKFLALQIKAVELGLSGKKMVTNGV